MIELPAPTFASAMRGYRLYTGKVTRLDIPISCLVCAYSRLTGQLLSNAHSDSNGNYTLFGVEPHNTVVIALDPDNQLNVVGQVQQPNP